MPPLASQTADLMHVCSDSYSNQFICESMWTFGKDVKKFPPDFAEILRKRECDKPEVIMFFDDQNLISLSMTSSRHLCQI